MRYLSDDMRNALKFDYHEFGLSNDNRITAALRRSNRFMSANLKMDITVVGVDGIRGPSIASIEIRLDKSFTCWRWNGTQPNLCILTKGSYLYVFLIAWFINYFLSAGFLTVTVIRSDQTANLLLFAAAFDSVDLAVAADFICSFSARVSLSLAAFAEMTAVS